MSFMTTIDILMMISVLLSYNEAHHKSVPAPARRVGAAIWPSAGKTSCSTTSSSTTDAPSFACFFDNMATYGETTMSVDTSDKRSLSQPASPITAHHCALRTG